jgi:5'-3' exonuclease
MTSNGSNRLDRIEAILESLGRRQEDYERRQEDYERRQEDYERRQEDYERRQEEIDRIVESNARAIQAMVDQRVEDKLEHEQNLAELREILRRVTNVQEGLARMLVSLDDDRPTILRKLNSIENKVDQILERERE